MTYEESLIADLLEEFVNATGRATASRPAVEILKELDRICAEQREFLDPRLVHYLERRSYEKARAHLANPEMPHKQ